jgi:hypothetical protein
MMIPLGDAEHPLVSVDTGYWVLRGFTSRSEKALYLTAPVILGGVVVPMPRAAVHLVSADHAGLTVEYEAPADGTVQLDADLEVRGVATCDIVQAGDAHRVGNRPEGKIARSEWVAPNLPVQLSPEPNVTPSLTFKVNQKTEVLLIDEEADMVRLVVERSSDWLVGWTARANLSKAPASHRTRIPRIRMGATSVNGNSLQGLIVCPHDLSVVAEVEGVRRTIGTLRAQAAAIRRNPGLPSGTESLLDLEGTFNLAGTEHGELFLQHDKMERCTCRPGEEGATRSRP